MKGKGGREKDAQSGWALPNTLIKGESNKWGKERIHYSKTDPRVVAVNKHLETMVDEDVVCIREEKHQHGGPSYVQ